MIEKSFTLDLECRLFLAMYPLDHQTCMIEIKPDKNNGHVISLMAMSLSFDGSSVNQYQIDKWEFKKTTNNKIIIQIEFTRQRMYFILNVILPIILINVVSFKEIENAKNIEDLLFFRFVLQLITWQMNILIQL